MRSGPEILTSPKLVFWRRLIKNELAISLALMSSDPAPRAREVVLRAEAQLGTVATLAGRHTAEVQAPAASASC